MRTFEESVCLLILVGIQYVVFRSSDLTEATPFIVRSVLVYISIRTGWEVVAFIYKNLEKTHITRWIAYILITLSGLSWFYVTKSHKTALYKLIVKYSSETLGIMLSRLVYVLRDKMLFVLYYFDVIMVAAIVYDLISKTLYYVGIFATNKVKKSE